MPNCAPLTPYTHKIELDLTEFKPHTNYITLCDKYSWELEGICKKHIPLFQLLLGTLQVKEYYYI